MKMAYYKDTVMSHDGIINIKRQRRPFKMTVTVKNVNKIRSLEFC